MALSVEDRLAITDVINLHGHFSDAGAFDRYDEILTEDVRYDTRALGGDVYTGLAPIVAAATALGDANPVAHLVLNIVIGDETDDGVDVLSKGLGLSTDGSLGCVTYHDLVVRTDDGWRIARRTITPRRIPLQPYPLLPPRQP